MSVAVISLGGKQFTVQPGKIICVARLAQQPEQVFELADLLTGKKVEAQIIEHLRGKKITVVKFKNKTRYLRRQGFRPLLTKVKINKIAE